MEGNTSNGEKVQLTRKERKEIERAKKRAEKQERRRIRLERKRGRYKVVQSTQMALPICDVFKGIVVTRDNRFIKILEFRAQNLLMFSNEKRNQIDSAFESALHVFPVKVQFKVFSRRADVESLVAPMQKCLDNENVDRCKLLLTEYIDYLKDIALMDGVTRQMFPMLRLIPFGVLSKTLHNALSTT